MSPSTSPITHGWRARLKRLGAAIAAGALACVGIAAVQGPAEAAFQGSGRYVQGVGAESAGGFWLGAYEPAGNAEGGYPAWCISMWRTNPTPSDTASIGTLVTAGNWGPADLTVSTPQFAWLLSQHQADESANNRAALSFLAHVNFEQADGSSHPDPAASVAQMIPLVRAQLPDVYALAQQYVSDAKNSAAIDYIAGTPTGDGQRTGDVHGIGVPTATGWLAGVSMTATLSGPAVFTSTGTNTWTGTTQSSPITLYWRSTGNGAVTFNVSYATGNRRTLTKYGVDGSIQDMLSYGNRPPIDPVIVSAAGASWRVIFDFQPIATTTVASSKIVDTATLSDTITAKADPSYGDGKWLQIDGKNVPTVYEGTAYYTGQTPATDSATIPTGAKIVGSTTITATGPGDYTATITGDYDPSFITWVWKVVKTNQPGQITTGGRTYPTSEFIHADWQDHYGQATETTSLRHDLTIDSALSTRTTKSGTYLVDDLWLTGLPTDHPTYPGSAGFSADHSELTQTLLFFPEDLAVTDANTPQAQEIATVTIPAKNGFYPSVGATDFKIKNGTPGTYVFVTTFPGDDRVKPLTTSVEDEKEQWVVAPDAPTLSTTATNAADGTKALPNRGTAQIDDEVCYTNLKPTQEYQLDGTLMDKATGQVIQDDEAEDIATTVTFVPAEANGCTTIHFDTDTQPLVGKTIVVFERLYRDGKQIAVHTDINDPDQTLTTPGAPTLDTTATDPADSDHTITADAHAAIDDQVCYQNLTVGLEYQLDGTLMDKATSQALQDNGEDIASTATFTPTKADDCQTVHFTLDASALVGKTIVVFEQITTGGEMIATHTDINDPDQSVDVKASDQSQGAASSGLAHTGADSAAIAGLAALLLAAAITTFALKRNRR